MGHRLQALEREALEAIAQELDRNPAKAETLVDEIGQRTGTAAWTYPTVRAAMNTLEELAERHEGLALRLMIALMEIAGRVQAHDVCDGIDLWLENSPHQELVGYLEARLTLYPDDTRVQHSIEDELRTVRRALVAKG